jgi:hypothetical protein
MEKPAPCRSARPSLDEVAQADAAKVGCPRKRARTAPNRSCRDKETYSQRAARQAARRFRDRQCDPELRAYPCLWCGRWHLGHGPGQA